jgi:hypothetical protein
MCEYIYRCYLAARSPDIIAWHHHGLPTMAASKAQFKHRHPAMVSTFHTYPYMLVIAPFLTFPLFSFMKNPSFIDKESTPWKGRASRPVGAKGMCLHESPLGHGLDAWIGSHWLRVSEVLVLGLHTIL